MFTLGTPTTGATTPFQLSNAVTTPFQTAFSGPQTGLNGQNQGLPAQANPMASLGAYHSAHMPGFFQQPPNFAPPAGNPFSSVQQGAPANDLINHLAYGSVTGSWNTPGYNPSHNYYNDYTGQQTANAQSILPGLLGAATPTQGQ